MRKSLFVVMIATAGLAMTSAANAACSTVSTKGTAGDKGGAMFMASGMRVGSAPGYKSAKMNRQSCNAGELGQVCHITATLCD